MEDECKKYEGYRMEIKEYGDVYANNLCAAWNLIKNSKVHLGIKMTVYSQIQKQNYQ